jgi:hypothetical protein
MMSCLLLERFWLLLLVVVVVVLVVVVKVKQPLYSPAVALSVPGT